MDQAKVGDRLRVARAASGLTQEQAAQRRGLARTTLVAIERADRPARPEELVALAKLYGASVHSLLRPSAVRVDVVAQFRRTRGAGADREGLEALALLHDLAAAHVELEQRLHKVTLVDYPPERKLGRGRVEQQAEELAAELRSRLGSDWVRFRISLVFSSWNSGSASSCVPFHRRSPACLPITTRSAPVYF